MNIFVIDISNKDMIVIVCGDFFWSECLVLFWRRMMISVFKFLFISFCENFNDVIFRNINVIVFIFSDI